MKCLNCDHDVIDNANFCHICGICLNNQRDGLVGLCAISGNPIRTGDDYFRCSQCNKLCLREHGLNKLPICSFCVHETGFSLLKENESPDDHKPEQSGTVPATVNESPSVSQPGTIWTEPVTGMEFVWVPGGKFMMGSPETEIGRFGHEGPQHEVKLRGFWMGKYPVTQAQWQKVMGSNPSHFKGERRPVERVSWYGAIQFCTVLATKSDQSLNFGLPSEAEWEYACRAGSKTPYYFGKTISIRQAAFKRNVNSGTTNVGLFPPNAFGLHDMHGNVWEWCEDVYDSAAYNRGTCKNPRVSNGGSHRVLRGGCWHNSPRALRSASRGMSVPGNRYYDFGFRLLRTN